MADCSEKEGYEVAFKKAVAEYPIIKKSTIHTHKTITTNYGYAYMIYFNKTTDATNADMVLITVNNSCEILHITAPTETTFYLQSKNECNEVGTIIGDNHNLTVNSCGANVQFKASNDALSKNFTKKDILEIKNIFKNAKLNYSKFKDKQVLYTKNGLKIWVRLYQPNKWFLVFDFVSIAPYPAGGEASVWIESNKFEEFITLLK